MKRSFIPRTLLAYLSIDSMRLLGIDICIGEQHATRTP